MFCGSRISASRRLSAPLCLSPAHRRPCIGSKRRPAKQNESQSSRRHRDRNHNQDHDIELGHPRFLRAAFLSSQQCTGSSTAPVLIPFPFSICSIGSCVRSYLISVSSKRAEILHYHPVSSVTTRASKVMVRWLTRCVARATLAIPDLVPITNPRFRKAVWNTDFRLPRALRLPSKTAVSIHARRAASVRRLCLIPILISRQIQSPPIASLQSRRLMPYCAAAGLH